MSKAKELKELIEQLLHLSPLNEMARVGKVAGGIVFVNSEDHNPPHINYIKDGKLVAKVRIPTANIKNKSELIVIDLGSAYQDYLLTSLIKWFNRTSVRGGVKGKNWQIAKFLWDSVHNK